MAKYDESTLMKLLNWAYDQVVSNMPLIGSATDLGNEYLQDNKNNREEAIDSLIRWQTSKAAATGFATGVGGLFTLPVTIPADIAGCFIIEMRMSAAIAHICGFDVHSDKTKTFCFAAMCGDGAMKALKNAGVELASKLATNAVKSISGATVAKINKAVGTKLVTKFGSTGIFNLGKMVPFLGGIVGGALDSVFTYGVGKAAKNIFYSGDLGDIPEAGLVTSPSPDPDITPSGGAAATLHYEKEIQLLH